MFYLGNRQVVQYQSIPKGPQANARHAGGVIDFDRDYYGADFRWTGRGFTQYDLVAGVALDRMTEDRKGYNNYNNQGKFGVKGDLRRNEKIPYGI